MAVYTTAAALQTRDSEADLVSLTARNGQNTIDASVLEQAIASAQAVIDSYIAGRVRLPLLDADVSPAIKHYALIIARYYVYADRKTEAVVDEYDSAIAWLRDVSTGKADSGVKQTPETGGSVEGARIVAPTRKPVFGDSFEARYVVPQGPNGSGEFGLS